MAETTSITIKGLDKITRNLKRYPKISEPIFQRAIEATAAVFAKNTLKDDPVPWRTGLLTQTFAFDAKRLQATWRPTRFYAPFVEFGTRRMTARPFMGTIMEKATPEVNKLFGQALDQVLKAVARTT